MRRAFLGALVAAALGAAGLAAAHDGHEHRHDPS